MLLFERDFINHYNYINENIWSETVSMFGDDRPDNINYHGCIAEDIFVFIFIILYQKRYIIHEYSHVCRNTIDLINNYFLNKTYI